MMHNLQLLMRRYICCFEIWESTFDRQAPVEPEPASEQELLTDLNLRRGSGIDMYWL